MAYIGTGSGCNLLDDEFDVDKIIGPGLFKNINKRIEVDVGYNISIINNKLVAFANYNFIFVNVDFNCELGRYYAVDTTGGQVTAILPSLNVLNGSWVGFVDTKNNFHNHTLIIDPNGKRIGNNPDRFEVDVSSAHVKLVYLDDNWHILDESIYGSYVDRTATINQKLSIFNVNTNFVAQLYKYHYVDTSVNALIGRLPLTFSNGDWFVIIDKSHSFDVRNVTILDQPGVTILNSNEEFKINTQRAKLKFIYFQNNWDVVDVSLD